MNEPDFRAQLVAAAFALGAKTGWRAVSPAAAARAAGLDLARARREFSCTGAILAAFGRAADEAALAGLDGEGTPRERLFEILLKRFDHLQANRAGVLALLRALPFTPPLAFALMEMTIASMGWLLEGAGIPATGLQGALKKRGLLGVWLYGVRSWERDESEDLAHTMAAIDKALTQAEALAGRFLSSPREPVIEDAPAASATPPDAE
ncbi:TetR family transcriptional regulator [Acidocella sp.]|uniref:TetR family transcriptional regulator n=1 Tax=Acidocella sp. TaxID=50710 RepID=UPI002611E4A6|nr:TetR family transcriptional regulator [Acidocella sp.]